MEIFNIIVILITLFAIFNYINHRFIGLPNPIGIMVIALLVSLLVIAAGALEVGVVVEAQEFARRTVHLAIELYGPYLLIGLAMIPLTLSARFIGVMRRSRSFSPDVI